MARDTRRRSTRKDQSLNEGSREVQLKESRRFFSSQGSDKATREARALQTAFGVGTDLATDLLERGNVKGGALAAGESAKGGERDVENVNKGYMEMWDTIEADNDIAMFGRELPEILREANWEDLEEGEAQALIDTYYSKQLKGINPLSIYGQRVAAGVMVQNTELLAQHGDFQLARVKQEQRTMIYQNGMNIYMETGVYPYDEVARQTNLAFDGPEKMIVWIEMLQSAALAAEDEDIITNAIKNFPDSGDPSGVDDPRYMPDLAIAKGKARAARERTEEKARKLATERREALRDDGRLELIELAFDDVDPTARAIQLARDDVIEPEDVTSAVSTFRTSRDDTAQHGANPSIVMQLHTQIAMNPSHPSLTPLNIQAYWAEGVFGPAKSPEAQSAAKAMMASVASGKDRDKRLAADPRKSIWTQRFDKTFAAETNQFGGLMSDNMTEIRAEFSSEFKLAILQAGSDSEYRKLWEDYSTRYAAQETLVNARANSGSPRGVFREFAQGNFSIEQAAAQARKLGYNAKTFSDARKAGELGKEFVLGSGSSEDKAYIAILTEMRKSL